MSRRILLILTMAGIVSCGSKDEYDPAHDYFSFANTGQFITRHIALDLEVDFRAEKLRATSYCT